MKKCPHCKELIEDDANFCIYCMKSLDKKIKLADSTEKKRKVVLICVMVLALALIVILMLTLKSCNDDNNGKENNGSQISGIAGTTASGTTSTQTVGITPSGITSTEIATATVIQTGSVNQTSTPSGTVNPTDIANSSTAKPGTSTIKPTGTSGLTSTNPTSTKKPDQTQTNVPTATQTPVSTSTPTLIPTATISEPTPTPIQVGDVIEFGLYEQDNDRTAGPEPIKWTVLDKKDDKILVITKDSILGWYYNNGLYAGLYKNCYVRKMLTEEFYNKAFTSEEQSKILTTTVVAHDNPIYNTDAGEDTEDKVFILCMQEVIQYFPDEASRKSQTTKYVTKCSSVGPGYQSWWTRTPGQDANHAVVVRANGEIHDSGYRCSYDVAAIRPAMWIDISDFS